MTVDDAAAILDVTEGHLKDLIRDGDLVGGYADKDGRYWPGRIRARQRRPGSLKPGEWWVDGLSVRARKRALDRRRGGRA